MPVTTFPRLKSAGVRGAKVVGKAQLVEVTVKATNGHKTKAVPVKPREGGGEIERGASISSK
jgi:hypothetical protein